MIAMAASARIHHPAATASPEDEFALPAVIHHGHSRSRFKSFGLDLVTGLFAVALVVSAVLLFPSRRVAWAAGAIEGATAEPFVARHAVHKVVDISPRGFLVFNGWHDGTGFTVRHTPSGPDRATFLDIGLPHPLVDVQYIEGPAAPYVFSLKVASPAGSAHPVSFGFTLGSLPLTLDGYLLTDEGRNSAAPSNGVRTMASQSAAAAQALGADLARGWPHPRSEGVVVTSVREHRSYETAAPGCGTVRDESKVHVTGSYVMDFEAEGDDGGTLRVKVGPFHIEPVKDDFQCRWIPPTEEGVALADPVLEGPVFSIRARPSCRAQLNYSDSESLAGFVAYIDIDVPPRMKQGAVELLTQDDVSLESEVRIWRFSAEDFGGQSVFRDGYEALISWDRPIAFGFGSVVTVPDQGDLLQIERRSGLLPTAEGNHGGRRWELLVRAQSQLQTACAFYRLEQ